MAMWRWVSQIDQFFCLVAIPLSHTGHYCIFVFVFHCLIFRIWLFSRLFFRKIVQILVFQNLSPLLILDFGSLDKPAFCQQFLLRRWLDTCSTDSNLPSHALKWIMNYSKVIIILLIPSQNIKHIKMLKNVVLLWGHIFGHFRSCFFSPLHPSPWYERQCLVLVILPLFPHSPWQELHWPQLHQAASPRLGHSDTSLSIRQILYSFLSFLSHFSPPSFGYVFIDLRLLNISH